MHPNYNKFFSCIVEPKIYILKKSLNPNYLIKNLNKKK